MTNEERFVYFESGALQQLCEIELLDWAGYWTTAGLGGITDPTLKEQTRAAIAIILYGLDEMIMKVSRLAISDSLFKTKPLSEITPADVSAVITSIMTYKLEFLTGIAVDETTLSGL